MRFKMMVEKSFNFKTNLGSVEFRIRSVNLAKNLSRIAGSKCFSAYSSIDLKTKNGATVISISATSLVSNCDITSFVS